MLFSDHFQIIIRAESHQKIAVDFYYVRIYKHRVTPILFNDVSSTAVITYEERTHKFAEGRSSKENSWNPNHRGAQISDARSFGSKKFCAVAPDIYGNSAWNFLLLIQHSPTILR
jgi:hypothetical protein